MELGRLEGKLGHVNGLFNREKRFIFSGRIKILGRLDHQVYKLFTRFETKACPGCSNTSYEIQPPLPGISDHR